MVDNGLFMKVDEVMKELDISKSHAYRVIKKLNDELSSKGFITISGRISRQYFFEKVYGYRTEEIENACV